MLGYEFEDDASYLKGLKYAGAGWDGWESDGHDDGSSLSAS